MSTTVVFQSFVEKICAMLRGFICFVHDAPPQVFYVSKCDVFDFCLKLQSLCARQSESELFTAEILACKNVTFKQSSDFVICFKVTIIIYIEMVYSVPRAMRLSWVTLTDILKFVYNMLNLKAIINGNRIRRTNSMLYSLF